jgi:hypothetical protein
MHHLPSHATNLIPIVEKKTIHTTPALIPLLIDWHPASVVPGIDADEDTSPENKGIRAEVRGMLCRQQHLKIISSIHDFRRCVTVYKPPIPDNTIRLDVLFNSSLQIFSQGCRLCLLDY